MVTCPANLHLENTALVQNWWEKPEKTTQKTLNHVKSPLWKKSVLRKQTSHKTPFYG